MAGKRDDATRQRHKQEYLAALRDGKTHTEAAEAVGHDRTTFWRWRQDDEAFDEECDAAELDGACDKLDEYETSVSRRVIAGDAAAVLEIWWATNLSARVARKTGETPRWQHVQRLEVTGKDGGPLKHEDVRSARDDILRDLEEMADRRASVSANGNGKRG